MHESNFREDSIRGWLLLYCLSRAMLEPLYLLHYYSQLPSLVERVSQVAFCLMGLVAVILIVKRRAGASFWIAADLLLRAAFSAVVFAHALGKPHKTSSAGHLIAASFPLVFAFGFAVAWLLYFKTSRRVFLRFGQHLLT